MRKKIGIVICIVLLIILIYVVYLKFFLKVSNINLLGYSFFIVKTGSMEPEILSGELIIVRKQDIYENGEIITYKENESFVTHRIITIDDNIYITRGDANNENDDGVKKEDILGKVIFHSYFLGKIITDYLKIIIIIYAVFVVLYEIFYNLKMIKSVKKC